MEVPGLPSALTTFIDCESSAPGTGESGSWPLQANLQSQVKAQESQHIFLVPFRVKGKKIFMNRALDDP